MLNTEILSQITLSSAVAVPVVVALVQVVKLTHLIKDKYAPFISLLMGILLAFLLAQTLVGNIAETILTGIMFGLSASGLYSGVRSSAEAIKLDRMNAHAKNEHRHNNDRRK